MKPFISFVTWKMKGCLQALCICGVKTQKVTYQGWRRFTIWTFIPTIAFNLKHHIFIPIFIYFHQSWTKSTIWTFIPSLCNYQSIRFFLPPFTIHQMNNAFKCRGSVSLCTKCARARNHVAQAREVKSNEEREQRLQALTTDQTFHIVAMRATKFFVQTMKGCRLKQSIKLPMW